MPIPPFSSIPIATFGSRGAMRQSFYNVRDFGARVNGVYDDSALINTAITEISGNGGGLLDIAGFSFCANSVILKSNVYLRSWGDGFGGLTGDNSDFIILKTSKSGTGKAVYSNIGLENLTIKSVNGQCIRLDNITNLYIKDPEVTFTATPSIRESLMIEHSQYVRIDSPYVHDVAGNGLQINGCDYVTINNPQVHNSYDDAIDIDKDFVDTGLISSRWVTINGGNVAGVTNGNGIRVGSCQHIAVNGTTVDNVAYGGAATGIYVNSYTDANDPGCSDVWINATVTNCEYAGVAFVDGGVGGVHNSGMIGGTISGCGYNARTGPLGAGIIMAAPNMSVSNVMLDNCGRTGPDGGAIVVFKRNGQKIVNNRIANSPTAINFWNGDSLQSYTDIQCEENYLDSSNAAQFSGLNVTTGSINNNYGVVKNGSSTFVGGTVTILNSVVTANSLIFCTATSKSANSGNISIGTIVPGTSFVINSTNALDANTFNWRIIN